MKLEKYIFDLILFSYFYIFIVDLFTSKHFSYFLNKTGIEVPSKDAVEVRKKVQYGKRKKNQQVEKQTEALKETGIELIVRNY